jgi:ribose/xylose/arabinose/galactoside ABC-type transport system permease subunit
MWAYRLVYAGPAAVPLLGGDGWSWQGTRSVELASAAALLAGLATGGLCGLANGWIITGLRLPPFVATLGMMSVARGLAYWLAEGRPLTFPSGGRPGWVDWLASTSPPYYAGFPHDFGSLPWWQQAGHLLLVPLLAPPVGFWSLVLWALAIWALLRYTVLGRYCYAIGSNEATARLCGVAVGRNKVAIYTLAGLLAGWAGVMSFANVDSGDPGGNFGLELIVIASVVIGGARLSGGQGTVLGTLLGVLILGVLENGVTAFKVPVEVKYILIGAIIIANTALSQWQRR